ncbi:hypothetical protein ACH4OY_11920 [Micromonospora rubida]|uniref:Helix-hairpin-helix domain-containing protein n=1 Tax=Micromonospora rubida TaxID=2697657 RepID=A0ABW7SKG1_9ACTN
MPSTFGQWLIMILALLLGAAAGWVLRGRQDAPTTGTPIVEGDPVAGVAVASGPTAEATVDAHRPEATVAPAVAPTAVVDPPAPETAEATRPGAVLADSDPTVFAPTDTATTGVPADAEPGPAPAAVPATDPSPVDAVTTGALSADAIVDNGTPNAGPIVDGGQTDDEASPAVPATPTHTEAAPVEATHAVATDAEAAPVEAVPAQVTPVEAALTETTPVATSAAEDAPVPAEATQEAAPVPVPATEEVPVPGAVVPAPRAAADDAELAPAVSGDAEPTPDVPRDAEAPKAESLDSVGEASPSAPDAAPIAAPSAATVGATLPTESHTETALVPVAAPSAATVGATADDFRRIQGIGPKMAAALQDAGIRTYRQLADLDEAGLRDTIRAAGLRGASSLATWPQQARVLAGAPAEADRVLPVPVGADDLS